MRRIREVPEIGNAYLRNKIVNGLDLVDDNIKEFLSTISTGSKIIEIEGGMGEISEHLAELGNNVKLIGEHRLFFVYRESVFPKSKVVPMNINLSSIKAGSKAYYDYAIIHESHHIDFAKSIAKHVYNVVLKEIHTKELGLINEEGSINSSEESVKITKNADVESSTGESVTPNDTVRVEQLFSPDKIQDSISSDNEPIIDLEQQYRIYEL